MIENSESIKKIVSSNILLVQNSQDIFYQNIKKLKNSLSKTKIKWSSPT